MLYCLLRGGMRGAPQQRWPWHCKAALMVAVGTGPVRAGRRSRATCARRAAAWVPPSRGLRRQQRWRGSVGGRQRLHLRCCCCCRSLSRTTPLMAQLQQQPLPRPPERAPPLLLRLLAATAAALPPGWVAGRGVSDGPRRGGLQVTGDERRKRRVWTAAVTPSLLHRLPGGEAWWWWWRAAPRGGAWAARTRRRPPRVRWTGRRRRRLPRASWRGCGAEARQQQSL